MLLLLQVFAYITGFIFVYRIVRYATTPILMKIGYYTYYSPMFFTLPALNNRLEIHLGTSYDFFRMQSLNSRLLIAYVAEGLVNLCEALELGRINKDVTFRGCIYFLNKTSLQRLGFRTRKLNALEYLAFSLNYFEVCLLQSIAKKKLCLVRFKDVTIAYCSTEDILRHKDLFARIAGRLQTQRKT